MRSNVLDLPGDLHCPSVARQFTRSYCREHQVDGPTTDMAVLLVSELVTNAVVHGRGAVRLELKTGADGALHVEVEDDDDTAPVLGNLTPDRQDGRGLAIIDSCARSWGTRPVGAGKIVWFEL